MMKLASSSSVAVSFGSRAWKRITPSSAARAPATSASPSTSSALAKIEPMIDVCATTTWPALSAKMTTKSSGRLPSVDWSTPVTAGPEALAHLLGGEGDDPRQARERHGREHEGEAAAPQSEEVRGPGGDAEHADDDERDQLVATESAHERCRLRRAA